MAAPTGFQPIHGIQFPHATLSPSDIRKNLGNQAEQLQAEFQKLEQQMENLEPNAQWELRKTVRLTLNQFEQFRGKADLFFKLPDTFHIPPSIRECLSYGKGLADKFQANLDFAHEFAVLSIELEGIVSYNQGIEKETKMVPLQDKIRKMNTRELNPGNLLAFKQLKAKAGFKAENGWNTEKWNQLLSVKSLMQSVPQFTLQTKTEQPSQNHQSDEYLTTIVPFQEVLAYLQNNLKDISAEHLTKAAFAQLKKLFLDNPVLPLPMFDLVYYHLGTITTDQNYASREHCILAGRHKFARATPLQCIRALKRAIIIKTLESIKECAFNASSLPSKLEVLEGIELDILDGVHKFTKPLELLHMYYFDCHTKAFEKNPKLLDPAPYKEFNLNFGEVTFSKRVDGIDTSVKSQACELLLEELKMTWGSRIISPLPESASSQKGEISVEKQ